MIVAHVDEPVDLGPSPDMRGHREGAAPQCLDLTHDRLAGIELPADNDDVGTGRCVAERDHPAEPAAAAGH